MTARNAGRACARRTHARFAGERLMSKVAKVFNKIVKFAIDKFSGSGLMQEQNVAVGERYVTDGIPRLIREAGAEGIVLLKNDGVLPIEGERVSLFGRCQKDWFYVGYGSGGDVNAPYTVSPLDAAKRADEDGVWKLNRELAAVYEKWCSLKENLPDDGWWGHWPMNYPEMPVDAELARKAAEGGGVAVVFIGRAAGEDRENTLSEGSYYLTREERNMLVSVTDAFSKTVVVIDAGNVIDMAWTEEFGDKLSAVLYAWQGGMESGNAVVDVLCGAVNPSGKLADTIARKYADYASSDCFGGKHYNNYVEDVFVGYRYFQTFGKDKVLYPFGHGLSYTTFEVAPEKFAVEGGSVKVVVNVKNTGNRAGKEVVQLYVRAPQGKLGKADKVLVAFAKTPLLQAGESCSVTLTCEKYGFASFDDTGATGHKHAYVLEKGTYVFLAGESVTTETVAGSLLLKVDEVLGTVQPVCGVKEPFARFKASEVNGKTVLSTENVPVCDYSERERISRALPSAVERSAAKIPFSDVICGKRTLKEFVATLSDEELEALTRGYGQMNAPQGVEGNAGAYGGIIPSLEEKGVPAVITTDGPAGIRIKPYTALLPCGTALACTWNTALVKDLYAAVGNEMVHYGADVLLGPGMNIHRNPLCGRNFEYFSEDPLLSGKMACAFTEGIALSGKSACPKHFACNNQEVRRNRNDSRVSERALREIYLKGFEICVKESRPLNIMTSYNKINGVWSHYNYDLATVVLREEWGYDGVVITDWWMRSSRSPEFPSVRDNAYRVRAQVDVFMPGNKSRTAKGYKSDGSLLSTLGEKDGITRGELLRSAENTLRAVAAIKFGKKFL